MPGRAYVEKDCVRPRKKGKVGSQQKFFCIGPFDILKSKLADIQGSTGDES